jgi:hypothetical protein
MNSYVIDLSDETYSSLKERKYRLRARHPVLTEWDR